LKAEAKRPPVRKAPENEDSRVRDLEKRLAEALRLKTEALEQLQASNRERAEAQEQQAATAEILRVISSSPTDVQPVFDVIAENAQRLLRGWGALVVRFDGELLHVAGLRAGPGASEEPIRERFPQPVRQDTLIGVVVRDRAVKQIADVETDDDWISVREHARRQGWRANLGVPMLHDGQPIGAITVTRREPGAFSAQEVDLLKTFAAQAVIAIENVRLFNETKEALERQTATAEILGVISSSPTDVQPVFDAIAASARRLCGGYLCNVARYEGGLIHLAAHAHTVPEAVDLMRQMFPSAPTRATASGRAILERAVVYIPDTSEDPEYLQPLAEAHRVRSGVSVPMLRDGQPIGVITAGGQEPRQFTDKQIALLQTFADQAVIAIENVRLFNETKEALEQQTATSGILRVIASSPTDVQPVFDTIAERAMRLCDADQAWVFSFDGELIHVSSRANASEEGIVAGRQMFPAAPSRGMLTGRAILTGDVVHVPDVREDPEYSLKALAETASYRGLLGVPMLHRGRPIGVISVARPAAGPFSDTQIALLRTFADQAVIAIENVRLFTELESSNRELRVALEQQTATSDLLKVIGRSTFDLQPVFETLVENARRLCEAERAFVHRFDGQLLRVVATHNVTPALREFVEQNPFPLGRNTVMAWAGLERRTIHIHDVQADPEITYQGNVIERVRTALAVPMLRASEVLGVIMVYRHEVRPFTDSQISLLETFADQAAIAIENARLLNELQARTQDLTRSVGELTALGEVGRALSSTLDLGTVLQTIVLRANELAGTAGCTIWEYDEGRTEFRLRASDYPDEDDAAALKGVGRVTTIRKGLGVTTEVFERRQPVQISDIAVEGAEENPMRRQLIEAGHRALLAVPLLSEDEVIGVLAVTRKAPGEFESETVRLLSTFATQSALAIQNARLFLEIEDKSRQLEAASQHKSEFLANMSHELRTPMNAILGFSEVLAEGMFGEINDKQAEYLRDILESGRHLLSLINDILDLSKVEAGRMELEATDFDLPSAIDNALTLVRERAGRRGITLGREIDAGVGMIRGDERKVKQVVLNLLSNAIKFTPEGGRIDVRASVNQRLVEVSVSDTGVGIAPEDQETVFEEFRQVGTADKKVEGTGLGLTLSRKFVELHGGRIWVKSQVGEGSTFTFTLPVRRAPSD
jgi:GAF domain-containing protein